MHVLRYVWPIFAPSPTVCEGILLANIGCCAAGCFNKILHFSHVLHEQYRTKLNKSSGVVESLDRCHYRNGFRLFDVYAMCCCIISYYYYYHFNNNTTSTIYNNYYYIIIIIFIIKYNINKLIMMNFVNNKLIIII